MPYERRAQQSKPDNSGKLFPNSERNTPKSPHCGGPMAVDGADYKAAAWFNSDFPQAITDIMAIMDEAKVTISIKVTPKTEVRRDSYDRSQKPQEAPRRQEDRPRYDRAGDAIDRPGPPPEAYSDEFDR